MVEISILKTQVVFINLVITILSIVYEVKQINISTIILIDFVKKNYPHFTKTIVRINCDTSRIY